MINETDALENKDTVDVKDEKFNTHTPPTHVPSSGRRRYTFGDNLAEARNKSRLQLERISKELKIRQDYLTALEESDPAHLPEPVFTMGFIRSYARMIKIDPEPHIEIYKKEVLHWKDDTQAPVPSAAPASFTQTWIVIAAAVGVLVLYGIWFLLNHKDSKIPAKPLNPQTSLQTGVAESKPAKKTAPLAESLKTGASVPVPQLVTSTVETPETKDSTGKPVVLPHSIKNTLPTPAVNE